jgi:pimeloyl-ACP methyl ester carboxylesterase
LPSGVNRLARFEHAGASLIDEILGDSSSRHIVFMHGWGLNRNSLRAIGVLFQRTHAVHLLDLPGFGEAPLPPADWDTIKYTDLVQQYVLDRMGGPVVLVGHSFGGRIALRLASRRLPQVRAIVLMAVPGLPARRFSRVRLRRAAIRLLRRLLRAGRPIVGPAPLDWHTRTFGSKDYLAAGDLRSVFVRTVNEDLTASAKSVTCPVLLIWGSDDSEAPPSLAVRFKKQLDGHATLEMLPHKDHHLYSGTGAHLCAFKIRSWLEAHAGS